MQLEVIPNDTGRAHIDSIPQKLEACGAHFTAMDLRLPEGLSQEDWADIGRRLLRADQVMQWWIGDWAAFGAGDERHEGWRKKGALAEFCTMNGFKKDYVRDKKYVSLNVHLSLRNENLPWSFYKEVAPLKPKEQKSWLQRAVKERLSVSTMRHQIRAAGGEINALENEGKSIPLGTQHYDDLTAWLDKRSAEFWTDTTKRIWRERLGWFDRFSQERLV